MKILAISAALPFPPVGGGVLRTYRWLQALASRHEVTLVAFTFNDEQVILPPFPVRVVEVPWAGPPLYREMQSDDKLVARRAYEMLRDEHPEPFYASYFDSPLAAQILRRELADVCDLVFIEDSDMGRFLPLMPADLPKVLDMQNVYALMSQRAAAGKAGEERRDAEREARRTLSFERSVAAGCELCLTCSESEATAVKELLGVDRVAVLPNGVDTDFFTPGVASPETGTLLFTGTMNYAPNIEAVKHFAAEILPLILRQRPDTVLHVVGKDPPAAVQQLQGGNIVVHGQVADVRPYFARAELVVAPILSGGGTRLKILDAAASGKAIVATTLGAEGLEFHPDRDIVLADSPDAFARSVVRLLGDPGRQSELGRNARRASLAYDWREFEGRLCEWIDDVLKAKHARER